MLIWHDSFTRACIAVIVGSTLTGCLELDPATVSSQPTLAVCYGIGIAQVGNAPAANITTGIAELRRRGGFTESELRHIAAGQIVPGMSESAAVCVKGFMYDHVNTTVVSSGTMRQLVYTGGGVVPASYIYTRNGVVTGVQF